MINVTKCYLPPVEKYNVYIANVFERWRLTNDGPLVVGLEKKLADFFNIENVLLLNNGTTAIQLAIKALDLRGKVITTPFSHVATTSAIVWEQCTPVFVDIQADTLNIDPDKIEAAIDKDTTAILATHVFGNPCDIEAIEYIARKHALHVIYDAAHCFGTVYKGRSVFDYGTITATSFHATKLFHTVEGGGLFTADNSIYEKLKLFRNFGHTSPTSFDGVGINAKNSELHAAMGHCVLDEIDGIMEKRKYQWLRYKNGLSGCGCELLQITPGTDNYNGAYFPLVFKNEDTLMNTVALLNQHGIYPRRYFYPSLNNLNYVNNVPCTISESISARVICLPLYHDLKDEEQDMIIRFVRESLD